MALALAAVGVVGLAVANAASLTVVAGQISTVTAGRPCAGTASVTPSEEHGAQKYDDVTVTLPAGCSGYLQVTVTEGSSALKSIKQVVAPGGTVVLEDVKNGG